MFCARQQDLAFFVVVVVFPSFSECTSPNETIAPMNHNKEIITLGAGCFWCVEAIFESIPGVHTAESGYAGGHIKNPGYREVCTGRTGHAEVVQLTFDSTKVPLERILEVFFATHDPTTLNRQGADVGTQYRSGIYWHDESQLQVIRASIEKSSNRLEQ